MFRTIDSVDFIKMNHCSALYSIIPLASVSQEIIIRSNDTAFTVGEINLMHRLAPYSRFGALKRLLRGQADNHATPCHRPGYRCVQLQWARADHLLSGQGTQRYGGRWMARGVTPVVYAASSEIIALKEARNNFSRHGIKPRKHPRVIVELELQLQSVINLPDLLRNLPWPNLPELLQEDWTSVNDSGQETLSQATGRVLFELGFEAVRVPSARDGRGFNLFIFPETLQRGSQISIVGKEELEKWLA